MKITQKVDNKKKHKKKPKTKNQNFLKGPCDADFGVQSTVIGQLEVVCIDQIALLIDELNNQEAWLFDPIQIKTFEILEERYVNNLPEKKRGKLAKNQFQLKTPFHYSPFRSQRII